MRVRVPAPPGEPKLEQHLLEHAMDYLARRADSDDDVTDLYHHHELIDPSTP